MNLEPYRQRLDALKYAYRDEWPKIRQIRDDLDDLIKEVERLARIAGDGIGGHNHE